MAVSAHIPCSKCEYDLFGTADEASCPECGTSVRLSLNPKRLIFVPPEKLKPIARLLKVWIILSAVQLALWIALFVHFSQILILPFYFVGVVTWFLIPVFVSLRYIGITVKKQSSLLFAISTISTAILGLVLCFLWQSFFETPLMSFLARLFLAVPSMLFLVLAGTLSARIPRIRLAYSLWGSVMLSNLLWIAQIPFAPWRWRWFGHIVLFSSPIVLMLTIMQIGLLMRRLGRLPFIPQDSVGAE